MHVIVGGNDSFRNTLCDALRNVGHEDNFIIPVKCYKTLLINARMHRADIIILEDNLRDTSALIIEIKQQSAETKVVLFTPRNKAEVKSADYIFPAKIQKNLEEQLSVIVNSTPAVTSEACSMPAENTLYYLRDLEIFEGIMKRMTSKEMGEWLFISPRTIEGQRRQLHRKTKTTDLVDLTLFGLENKWIEGDRKLTALFFELKRKAL